MIGGVVQRVHLSPIDLGCFRDRSFCNAEVGQARLQAGRGRSRSERVRGCIPQSGCSVCSINSRTPSRLSYTSLFETRSTRNPNADSASDRARSFSCSVGVAWVTPSTSTMSFPSSDTKSTMYRSIGCCRRNFQRAMRRLRNACQSRCSALVCDERRRRARDLNCSIPLTRLLRSRPLPNGERYSTAAVLP
jgi:hypothetical protein